MSRLSATTAFALVSVKKQSWVKNANRTHHPTIDLEMPAETLIHWHCSTEMFRKQKSPNTL
jgi:hypothetical protein